MTIAVGEKLPDATFRVMTADGPEARKTGDIFSGKKVVLFGVPGAFTPTCHLRHLPGFLDNAEAMKARGVDAIAVTAVNDPFVMRAWADATGGAEKITFLSDGNAEFAKATGLSLDASGGGLGTRNQRFAMIVDDGVVRYLAIEDAPGKAEQSGAEALMKAL